MNTEIDMSPATIQKRIADAQRRFDTELNPVLANAYVSLDLDQANPEASFGLIR
jgi:hypothetical protein